MGKVSYCGYLISQFYTTREIRKNLMHVKNVFRSPKAVDKICVTTVV